MAIKQQSGSCGKAAGLWSSLLSFRTSPSPLPGLTLALFLIKSAGGLEVRTGTRAALLFPSDAPCGPAWTLKGFEGGCATS